MPIDTICEICCDVSQVPDSYAGSFSDCKQCGARIDVPAGPVEEELFASRRQRKKRPRRAQGGQAVEFDPDGESSAGVGRAAIGTALLVITVLGIRVGLAVLRSAQPRPRVAEQQVAAPADPDEMPRVRVQARKPAQPAPEKPEWLQKPAGQNLDPDE